jgi:hypothetical protein
MKRRQFLKLAALTAALGASVGVDVADALAAGAKQANSLSNKADSVQFKADSLQFKRSQQFKFKSKQVKIKRPVVDPRTRNSLKTN